MLEYCDALLYLMPPKSGAVASAKRLVATMHLDENIEVNDDAIHIFFDHSLDLKSGNKVFEGVVSLLKNLLDHEIDAEGEVAFSLLELQNNTRKMVFLSIDDGALCLQEGELVRGPKVILESESSFFREI